MGNADIDTTLANCTVVKKADVVKTVIDMGLRFADVVGFEPDLKLFPYEKEENLSSYVQ